MLFVLIAALIIGHLCGFVAGLAIFIIGWLLLPKLPNDQQ